MNPYSLILLALLLVSWNANIKAQSPSPGHSTALKKPPNIVILTIDSCRADRFGVYGNSDRLTPHIDRWADSGTVFLNAYSTSAWTAPGLVSLLTGLYPPSHGVNNRDRTGPADLVALPGLFRSQGYRVPNLNFFTFAPYYQNLGLGAVERKYFEDGEGQEVLNWLEANAGEGDDPPFFLWYHSTLVHQPYHPGEDRLPRPLDELEKSEGLRAVLRGAIVPVGSVQFQSTDRPLLEALYDAEVKRTDELFGAMMAKLKEKGVLENTVVVLSADHGEELLDHGFVGHASTSLQAKLYQEVIRIPLILSWPGVIPSGKIEERPVSQIDLFPTLLRLAGMESGAAIEGKDLFQGRPHKALFFESVVAGNQTTREKENQWLRAVIRDRFKYIDSGELYDLVNDPHEQVNLVESRPKLASELKMLLQNWVKTHSDRGVGNRTEAGNPTSGQAESSKCPQIFSPSDGTTLQFDTHTGALIFDWSGSPDSRFLIEYDIGRGDHVVSGRYEVEGNHQILGPFPRELWTSLKAWNPFLIRVTPDTDPRCWSDWVEFAF